MKLDLNTKQLELLEFIMSEFKCQDDEEEELILQLEQNLNELGAKESLRLKSITEAQEKHPEPEW